jgi:adenylyl-sulfate kinase
LSKSKNLVALQGKVTVQDRTIRNKHTGLVVWMTGLSGSGKTSIAIEAEKVLFDRGYFVLRLDGDHLRQGLCTDLGFSVEDRAENIRRAGEVSKLFYEAGAVVLASFISPTRQMRAGVRERLPQGAFTEVFVCASLQTCMKRDPKGFYKSALRGTISGYTGIDQEYEEPDRPELILDTEASSLDECVQTLVLQVINQTSL